ncbi:hypothetical protein RCL1_006635 [Eukaryota sp. TZLM3-RCL]
MPNYHQYQRHRHPHPHPHPRPSQHQHQHKCILVVNAPDGCVDRARKYFGHYGSVVHIQHAIVQGKHRFLVEYQTEDEAAYAHRQIKLDPVIKVDENKSGKLYVIRANDIQTEVHNKPKLSLGDRHAPLPPYVPPPHPDQEKIWELVNRSKVMVQTPDNSQYPLFYGQGGMYI